MWIPQGARGNPELRARPLPETSRQSHSRSVALPRDSGSYPVHGPCLVPRGDLILPVGPRLLPGASRQSHIRAAPSEPTFTPPPLRSIASGAPLSLCVWRVPKPRGLFVALRRLCSNYSDQGRPHKCDPKSRQPRSFQTDWKLIPQVREKHFALDPLCSVHQAKRDGFLQVPVSRLKRFANNTAPALKSPRMKADPC